MGLLRRDLQLIECLSKSLGVIGRIPAVKETPLLEISLMYINNWS